MSPYPKSLATPLFGGAALALSLFASYWSVRYAIADFFYRENTLESLHRAVAIAPGNAAFWSLLAEQTEGAGLNPDVQLQKTVELSPLESRYWIRLGFRAEVEHDYSRAEQDLLHAARVDHKFAPRWALMNFYFRRNNIPEFWRWTDKAFEFSYDDVTPLFRLMWDVTSDAADIEKHIPRRRDVAVPYLWFLIDTNRLDASLPIAREVAAMATEEGDANPLLTWWEKVYRTNGPEALGVWNTLCDRKVLPFAPLNPAEGKIVTNGDFAHPPIQRGSDWRLSSADSIFIQPDPASHQIAIRFSGKEAEEIVLMEQWLPVEPGRHYIVKSEYQAPPGNNLPGIDWTISGTVALAHSDDFTQGADWQSASVAFESLNYHYVCLNLLYKRPLGSTRAEGTLLIRNITSQIAGQGFGPAAGPPPGEKK